MLERMADDGGDTAPASPPTVDELLARVGGGDRAAFAALYDQTAPRLFGLIRRLVVDPAQAEEVTQDVYLEIWQSAARFDVARGSAIAWMFTLAHRRAVDRIRSSQAARDRDLRIGARDLDVPVDSVAEAAETIIEHERVQGALGELSDLQRECVALAYYGGLTQSEIAERLQVPLGTVKTRLRDGMIRLRTRVGGDDMTDDRHDESGADPRAHLDRGAARTRRGVRARRARRRRASRVRARARRVARTARRGRGVRASRPCTSPSRPRRSPRRPRSRRGLMAALDRVPQRAPDSTAPAAPETAAPAAAPAAAAAAAPPVRTPDAPTPGPVESAARRRWFQRPVAIVVAAAAAVVLIAGVVVGIGWTGPNGWGAQREMAAIAEAPDAQSQTHEVEGGGEITLVASAEQGRSGVVVEGLPELGTDQTYELWYIDDAGADHPPARSTSRGSETWRVLDGSFTPGVAVGVTVEPAGGSPQPTTEPIVVIPT